MDSTLGETNAELQHMYMVPAYECPLLLCWWPSLSLLKTKGLPQYPPMPPRSIPLGWYCRSDQLHHLCWLPGPAARPLRTFLRFSHLRQAPFVCLLLQLILAGSPSEMSDSASTWWWFDTSRCEDNIPVLLTNCQPLSLLLMFPQQLNFTAKAQKICHNTGQTEKVF